MAPVFDRRLTDVYCSWWPDGQIFRSTDSGATWTALWSWGIYPDINKNYAFTDKLAPWLGPDATVTTLGTLQIGYVSLCWLV